ncbi:RING finger protein 17-like [Anneissia japonica]|uniref:RING finger protein 17-like n=1 Tax=Anneissia japonica TaxID=1529436 RepID=UPI0014255E55|nr:RING finger protein 17-like [Anneissia japonica]
MQRYPSCPNCCKSFRGQDPVGSLFPHLLQCGHTFCRSCLLKLMRITRTNVICPICKTATPTPLKEVSIDELPSDFYILGVLLTMSKKQVTQKGEGKFVPRKHDHPVETTSNVPEVFRQFKEKVTGENEDMCVECIKKPATCMCAKCNCLLCGVCFDKIHQNSRILMMHQATPLKQKGSTDTCRDHSMKTLDFFCREDTCMHPVCANCCIIGSHKGHSIQQIEERNREIVHELQPAINKAEATMKDMLMAKKTICEAMPEVKFEVAKVVGEVRTHFSRLHAILQAREMALIDNLDAYLETQIDTVTYVQRTLETNISCALGAITEARKATSTNKVINTTQLLALLDATTDLPSLIVPPGANHQLQFKLDLEDLPDMIANYGSIEGFDTDRYKLKALTEISEDVTRYQSLSNENQLLIDRMVVEMQNSCKEPDSQSVNGENKNSEPSSPIDTNQSKATSPESKNRKPYRQRTYLPREPPGEKVIVTHIRSPWDFMVQRLGDQGKVNNMMGYLQKFCRAPTEKELTADALSIGTMVCCQYSFDKKWYRAIIMSSPKSVGEEDDEVESKDDTCSEISESTSMRSVASNKGRDGYVEVVYIDYGNTEWAPVTSIRKMCTKYKKMPELALRCSLKDIVPANNKPHWSRVAVHAFAEMTSNKPLHMTIVGNEGSLPYVDLHEVLIDDVESEAPASLRDALVFLELACFISEESICRDTVKKTSTVEYFKPYLPNKNDYIDVMVSHINSPHNFYVQEIVLGDQYLQTMMDELQKHYSSSDNSWHVLCPHMGMVCVAKYADDDFWYRSQVVGLPGDGMVDVMYVDFGNVSRVHVKDLRMMAANFLKLPIQALACSMVDVAAVGGSWSEESATRLGELSTTPLVIAVQGVKNDIVSVLLYSPHQKDDACLNAVLVAEGLAKSTGPGSVNAAVFKKYQKKASNQEKMDDRTTAVPEPLDIIYSKSEAEAMKKKASEAKKKLPYVGVRISHVVSPSCLYVQLKTAGKDGLESLQKAMMEHLMKTPVDTGDWTEGDIGAMIYMSNDFYSRAKVIELIPENKAKVEMIDYGNTNVVTVSKLRRLTSELASIQPFAIRCHLANVFPAGGKDWTKTACEYLAGKLQELECYILKEDEINKDGSFPIDLLYKKSWKELAKGKNTEETELVSELLINDGLALPSPQRKKKRQSVESVDAQESDEALRACSRLSKYCISDVDCVQKELLASDVTEHSKSRKYETEPPEKLAKNKDGLSGGLEEHHLPEVDQESQCMKDRSSISSEGILAAEKRREIAGNINDVENNCFRMESLSLSDQEGEYDSDRDSYRSSVDSSVCSLDKNSVHSTTKSNNIPHSDNRSTQSLDRSSVHSPSNSSLHHSDEKNSHSSSKNSIHSPPESSIHSHGKSSSHHSDRSVHSSGKNSPVENIVLSLGKSSDQSPSGSSIHDIGNNSVDTSRKSSVQNSGKSSACSSIPSSAYNSDDSCLPGSDIAESAAIKDSTAKYALETQQNRVVDIDKTSTPDECNANLDFDLSSEISLSDGDNEPVARKSTIVETSDQKISDICDQMSSHGKSQPDDQTSNPYVQYGPFEMPTCNPCDIVVTFINEQGIIYGHEISEGKILLKEIMEELQGICSKRRYQKAVNWQPGQACFAQFSLDSLWYRGKVLSVQKDTIWVQYVDFGNSEAMTADKLRIATCFTEIPHQCLECILYGSRIVNAANCWPTNALKFMYENLTVCTIERKGKWRRGSPLLVEITMPNGQNLREALLNGALYNSQDVIFCDDDNDYRMQDTRLRALSEKERIYYLGKSVLEMSQREAFLCDSSLEFVTMELPPPGVLFNVIITHTEAPNQLFIQHFQGPTENPMMREAISQLNQLMVMNDEINQLAPSWPPVTTPFVGLCCVGLYGQESKWYRAKILKVSNLNLVTIQYVDFGTPERVTTDRLRYLPAEYFDLPVQAVLCEVYGLLPPSDTADDCEMLPTTDWPLASLTRLLEVIANKEQVAKVLQHGSLPKICLYNGFEVTLPMSSVHATPSNYIFMPLVEEKLAELDNTNIGSGCEM